MIFVQDRARPGNIDAFFIQFAPGQRSHPVQIAAHHGMLTRGFRHAAQAFELLARFLLHFIRHASILNSLFELCQIAVLIVITKLLLNGFQLFAQHIFALALIHFLLGLLVDFLRQLEHFNTMIDQFNDVFQSFAHI